LKDGWRDRRPDDRRSCPRRSIIVRVPIDHNGHGSKGIWKETLTLSAAEPAQRRQQIVRDSRK